MIITRELETLFFILVASAIGLFAGFSLRESQHHANIQFNASLPTFLSASDTPTPLATITSPIPKVTTTDWTSSDGTEKISIQTTIHQNESKTYVSTLTDAETNQTATLFTQTISGISSMSIPFNAFSPDNAYVFLKETLFDGNHYLVFKTSGKPFADGKVYTDITPLFSTYTSQYTLGDVTGWAAPTLLIVNADKPDGTIASSFWFGVTSRSFIPLATIFR
jgi:hypothetical protein